MFSSVELINRNDSAIDQRGANLRELCGPLRLCANRRRLDVSRTSSFRAETQRTAKLAKVCPTLIDGAIVSINQFNRGEHSGWQQETAAQSGKELSEKAKAQ